MEQKSHILRYMEKTKNALLERFLRYVKTYTESSAEKADAGIIPSSPDEAAFAEKLKDELIKLGITDVTVTEHAYVCARIPASAGMEDKPVTGLLAHMDTAEEVTGKNVNPNVIENYDGKPITLKNGIILEPEKDICLAAAKGETIITTDGTTLLGADDKAGIAVIMTAAEKLMNNPEIKHGAIEIIFSPDEETGHGMDFIPLDWMQSKHCYTLDGGHVGELETECFTAYKSEIDFTGVAMHTGTARPRMVNAVTMAAAFVNLLPQNESPEATDEYLGFYAPMKISGTIENAQVVLFLRDFEMQKMQQRMDTVTALAKAMEYKFPGGKVNVTHTKQYLNMKNEMDKHPEVVEKLVKAAEAAGVKPVFRPIRGGTDGSRLSEMGIPTPNVFTGGHNFHSRTEWASLDQMLLAVNTVIELIKQWAI